MLLYCSNWDQIENRAGILFCPCSLFAIAERVSDKTKFCHLQYVKTGMPIPIRHKVIHLGMCVLYFTHKIQKMVDNKNKMSLISHFHKNISLMKINNVILVLRTRTSSFPIYFSVYVIWEVFLLYCINFTSYYHQCQKNNVHHSSSKCIIGPDHIGSYQIG